MKTKILVVIAVIIMAGCASQPDYRQAKQGGFGYTESKLSDTQYRVHFKAKGTDKAKAMDYAMLRAAELTLLEGYDWFVVTDRETLVDKETVQTTPTAGFSRRYARVTDCGVLTCRTSYHPTTQFETGVFVGGSQKSEIESILNIELGKGTRPSSATSFDAREVRENLQPNIKE